MVEVEIRGVRARIEGQTWYADDWKLQQELRAWTDETDVNDWTGRTPDGNPPGATPEERLAANDRHVAEEAVKHFGGRIVGERLTEPAPSS